MATDLTVPFNTDDIRLRWREARGNKPSTATINFIVYVENERYRDWVFTRAQRIADKHPCRMIVLDAVAGERGVTITAQEPDSADGPSIFRERVDLGVDGIRAAQRAQFVESLLVRDVPTVLWWAADRLFESDTFRTLMPQTQHVILDSSGTNAEPDALHEFAKFFEGNEAAALSDLAWMRLEPWRDVVAQFFDDPNRTDELFSLRRVSISSGSDSEALYLGAWLAGRLGWTVKDANTFTDKDGAKVEFRPKRDGDLRRVKSVKLESDSSEYSAYVSGEDALCLEASGKHAFPKRHVPLDAVDNTSLIERAILEQRTDAVFLETLRVVGQILN